MNLPPPEDIQKDIYRLVVERTKCEQNATALENSIGDLRLEQAELNALIEEPGYYDVEALKANAARIDSHIIRTRAVIGQEEQKIERFDYIIADLEERKCRSEMISALTGTQAQES
jgi:hypothetical protein